jgi:hypothetical protein
MAKFKVTVVRHWKEYGELEVEADDITEARELASDTISSGDDFIEWGDMTPENDDIESCEEIQ